MAINLNTLFQGVKTDYGTGIDNERLEDTFIRATNRALDELTFTEDRATAITHVTQTAGTITELLPSQTWILDLGIRYWLTRLGIRPGDPKIAQIVYNDTASEWVRAKQAYWTNILNVKQATDSNSIIGLGYVGGDDS